MHPCAFLLMVVCLFEIEPLVVSRVVPTRSTPRSRLSNEVAAERLALLREQMRLHDVDAWIIQTADAHQTAYIAERDKRREWISGFTGGAGTAVVTSDFAALWTDSRYYEQADLELTDDWILMKSGLSSTPSLSTWLPTVLSESSKVGVDPEIVTYAEWTSWSTALGTSNISLVTVQENLIDLIWVGQPDHPSGPIYEHPLSFAGSSREERLVIAREAMVTRGVDLYVMTALDEIAWITNLRGSDIPNSPLFRSYLLITNTTAILYVPSPADKLNATLAAELHGGNDSYSIADYENFWTDLEAASDAATKISLPSAYSYALGISYKVYSTVTASKVQLQTSPVLLVKDRKTEFEAAGMRNAHLKDAVALCQFLAILEEGMRNSEVWDELRVDEELSALRRAQAYNVGNSFETIAAYGPNSALPHYTATNETNVVLGTDSTFMLDSGGQYYDGTTDVTRTMHYGTPTAEHIATYTALLAGCIDLATLVFPVGQSYTTTDLLMRSYLYKLGRNYGHGSTHGIGHFLVVHEAWNTTYDVNFFGSQEPGYYQESTWGMRLENIVAVVPANTTYDPEDTFVTFETVTLVPYARNLIDVNKLTDNHLQWLNQYHATVREKVGAELLAQGLDSTYEWLIQNTIPISRRSYTRSINFIAIP